MSKNSVSSLVDHLFRNEYGKAVSFLTNKFGSQYIDQVEDTVQEALIRAMQTWPFKKIPDNPTGWIIRVANNIFIDRMRRSGKVIFTDSFPEDHIYQAEKIMEEGEFNDDLIRMMFACCNPRLSTEYQIILTLKILCGLSIKEISSALLKKEETVAKSYTRAKKKFKQENLSLVLPGKHETKQRTEIVLKSIYLLFNEGYKRTEGNALLSKDLCHEAMRLNDILLQNSLTNNPSSRSLMALICFQMARFESRTNTEGSAISFPDQDRELWDQEIIKLGNQYLNSIKKEDIYNEYFLQAAISGFHCNTSDYQRTPWRSILKMYDLLFEINPNPMIGLNRIIPIQKVNGPEIAMQELLKPEISAHLNDHYLYFAVKADLEIELGRKDSAKHSLMMAAQKTKNQNEKGFLMDKLHKIA